MISTDQARRIVKGRDIGIAGAVIILSQLTTNFSSSKSITDKIESLANDIQTMKIEREEFFVRKSDLIPITERLDRLNEQLQAIQVKLNYLKAFVKDYSLNDGTIGCSVATKDKREYVDSRYNY